MRKKIISIYVFYSSILLINSCQEYVKLNPITNIEEITTINDIIVPNEIIAEESIEDPQETGVDCSAHHKKEDIGTFRSLEIPDDLPLNYDLSEDMPPVRSQGRQGSCVAWATTYYLKSYQEKIQHEYDYESYEAVMSPSFIYNQAKGFDCGSGSSIITSLTLLKEQGVATWKDFPYSDEICHDLPTDEVLEKAIKNKINDFAAISVNDSISALNYTLSKIIKALIYQKQPVIISMKNFKDLNFRYKNSYYIADAYRNLTESCGHAILITGYDDELNAFKIVNSWGTLWGNEGYAWIDYSFFLTYNDVGYQEGVMGKFVAYDEEEDMIVN